MAQVPERVRVILERSGGLIGRSVRRGLDTADLPEPEAATLRSLASGAVGRDGGDAVGRGGADAADGPRPVRRGQPPSDHSPEGQDGAGPGVPDHRARGADRFIYTLEVDRPGQRAVRTFSEPVPDEVRPLLALLRTAPVLPTPHP